MAEAEYLIGLAQIALGLTGFTGVVLAYRNKPSEWSDADRMRFFLLLTTSIGAIFNTLLPLVLNALGMAAPRLWHVSSAVTALCFITIAIFYYRRLSRVIRGEEPHDVNFYLTVFLTAGSLATIVVQSLNAFRVFGAPFGVFLTGLIWGLFVPAVQFGRMVYMHFVKKPTAKNKQQPLIEDKGRPATGINENERQAARAEPVGSGVEREGSQKK
ncbi:MAG TPA: hypothetical protein VF544_00935 [Pyrinomonadaceae bacterium]